MDRAEISILWNYNIMVKLQAFLRFLIKKLFTIVFYLIITKFSWIGLFRLKHIADLVVIKRSKLYLIIFGIQWHNFCPSSFSSDWEGMKVISLWCHAHFLFLGMVRETNKQTDRQTGSPNSITHPLIQRVAIVSCQKMLARKWIFCLTILMSIIWQA